MKTRKCSRVLALLLALCMLSGVLVMPAAATDETDGLSATYTVGSVTEPVKKGDEVTIPVTFSESAPFNGIELWLGYDSKVLEMKSINTQYEFTAGDKTVNVDYLDGIYVTTESYVAKAEDVKAGSGIVAGASYGIVTFASNNSDLIETVNGTLFTVTFTCISDRVDSTPVSIAYVDTTLTESGITSKLNVTTVPGTIAIEKAAETPQSHTVTLTEGTGYTLTGGDTVENGANYQFSIAIADGYESGTDFAVKANGETLTPDTDSQYQYTVTNVTEDLTITVEGVQQITHTVTLPTGQDAYTVYRYGKYSTTVAHGGEFKFFVEANVGYDYGDDFTVMANGETLTSSGGIYTISNITEDVTVTVSGVEEIVWESVTVYFSFSHDDKFESCDASGQTMALKEITVPYFDLERYDLQDFYFSSETYGDDGDGLPGSDLAPGTAQYAYGKITMLHLFIYATEVYYCGIDEEDAGKGYLYDNNILGSDVFYISGSQGSTFLNNIWNYDLNLNYYLNYEYPLASEGWGSTSDQILLHDGDIVTLGHFTSWSFFGDSTSVFNHIEANNTEPAQGDEITLTLYHDGADMMGTYNTAHTKIDYCPDVYYAPVDDIPSGDVTEWTYVGTAEADGTLVVDLSKLDLEPGKYIFAMAGQYGAEYTEDICSTPGGVLLEIQACRHSLTKISAKEATCTEAGNMAYWKCIKCGKLFSDAEGTTETTLGAVTISATGHSLTKVSAKEATCTEAGNKDYWQCSKCGKLFSDAEGTTETTLAAVTIEATGHSLTKVSAKEATCTEAGNKDYWQCSNCGKLFSDAEGTTETTLDAVTTTPLDHLWVLDSTQSTAAENVYRCDRCRAVKRETVEIRSHTVTVLNGSGSGEYNEGQTVTIKAASRSGYAFSKWVVLSGDVRLANERSATTSFEMPAGDVRIEAVYVKISIGGSASTTTKDSTGTAKPKLPFTDVKTSDWFYDSVKYVYQNGLMNGTGAANFSPNATLTRGMLVTVLYRLEGEPAVSGGNSFTDVSAAAYYADAVTWAARNGIVTGYSDSSFGPDNNITREQLAAILYRYAAYKGCGTDARADLSGFTDAAQISSYAVGAVQWACAEGLVKGRSATQIAPTGTATRAEAAALLTRFAALLEK